MKYPKAYLFLSCFLLMAIQTFSQTNTQSAVLKVGSQIVKDGDTLGLEQLEDTVEVVFQNDAFNKQHILKSYELVLINREGDHQIYALTQLGLVENLLNKIKDENITNLLFRNFKVRSIGDCNHIIITSFIVHLE